MQRPPVLFDRGATLAKRCHICMRRPTPEPGWSSFRNLRPRLPGGIWRRSPGDDYELTAELHRLLLANSIDLGSDGLIPFVTRPANEPRGRVRLHERDGDFGSATLYNTLVTIGPDGAIANRHRKLVPTNPERMVWGQGDGSGLRGAGHLAGSPRWPHLLGELHAARPLHALQRKASRSTSPLPGTSGDAWVATLRHIAAEGRCCGCLAPDAPSIPRDVPPKPSGTPEPVYAEPRLMAEPGRLGHRRTRRTNRRWPHAQSKHGILTTVIE